MFVATLWRIVCVVGSAETKVDPVGASAASAHAAVKKIMLLDGKRQQNTGIVLGRLRMDGHMVRIAVRAAHCRRCVGVVVVLVLIRAGVRGAGSQILHLDFAALTADRISLLQSIVLTSEEEEQIRSHEGPDSELADVDRFYAIILDVPRCVAVCEPRNMPALPTARAAMSVVCVG